MEAFHPAAQGTVLLGSQPRKMACLRQQFLLHNSPLARNDAIVGG